MCSTMTPPMKKRRLLFLHVDVHTPPAQRSKRRKVLDSQVRHHLMVDIGRSRRKPNNASQFATFEWSLSEDPELESIHDRDQRSESPASDSRGFAATNLIVPDARIRHHTFGTLKTPFLYALSVFENEWGEDWFSAYGFTLIMIAGRDAMNPPGENEVLSSGLNRPGAHDLRNSFWFPFAFRNSAFLNHYQAVFRLPDILIPLYRTSCKELQRLALERSLQSIQCIQARLSSSDMSIATSDSVLEAVTAVICYNFASLDFSQAMVHLRGICLMIATRGGPATLHSNQHLTLMLSWIDVTAAMLYDTNPLLPLHTSQTKVGVFPDPSLAMVPAPLREFINAEKTKNKRVLNVLSCLGELSSVAAYFDMQSGTNGYLSWQDEEQISSRLNPVAHRLLGEACKSKSKTRCDKISEALRLGALVWIIQLKRLCRSYPGTAEKHISALVELLSDKDGGETRIWDSPELQSIHVWLLVLCSISGPCKEDLRTCMEAISGQITQPKWVSWARIMSVVRQMPWIGAFEPPCARVGQLLLQDASMGLPLGLPISAGLTG